MKKKDAMVHWRNIEPNQPILPHMTAIPYKSKGSKYGACGIRIDGNPRFVDAVLSRLKDLLEGESARTRLQFSRSTVENVLDKKFVNRDDEAECVYIRLCERGSEGQILRSLGRGSRVRRKAAELATAKLGI